jgi:protein-tyrosine phosphatase
MNHPPFRRSYWVVPGNFLVGCYPGSHIAGTAAAKIQSLIDTGVTDFITLMEENETNHFGLRFEDYMLPARKAADAVGRDLSWRRHPIKDGGVTTVKAMQATLDDIDSVIQRGGVAYVHCWGGRGRTGSVVCCWLVRHGQAAPTHAVEKMHALIGDKIQDFHPTPENDEQRLFIEQWCLGQ